MRLSRFFRSSLLGLDIQPENIRFVLLKRHHSHFLIEQIALCNLPPEILIEGQVHQWDKLRERLTASVTKLKLTQYATVLVLPEREVSMQHLTLPMGMSDDVIQAEIKAQLNRDRPEWRDTRWSIDFNASPHKNADYLDVFFVATPQSLIEKYQQCVTRSGLNLKIIEVDSHALKRMEDHVLPLDQFKRHASVDSDFLTKHASLFLRASGAAMRRVPKW